MKYACHYKLRLVFFFYPFFTAADTADNLCTKQGNVGLKSTAYKRERLMMACVRHFLNLYPGPGTITKLMISKEQKFK